VDPIVGVSFTGLFDFLFMLLELNGLNGGKTEDKTQRRAKLFKSKEQKYLTRWKNVVNNTVQNYCTRHKLKTSNRATTVQPSGCLDRTALRIFDQGLIYADEVLTPGDWRSYRIKFNCP
jgi:ribonucleotide reductase class II